MYFFDAITTIWQREIYRYLRDRPRIVSTLVQPLVFLAILGSGLGRALAKSNLGIDFIKFMYPGIIAISVMGVAFFSTISTVWDREFGFLREMLVAPISRTSIALGKTSGAATIAIVQALILLIIAPFIGISIHFVTIVSLLFFMLLLSLAVSGLGLFIASLLDSLESYGPIMQLLVFPMFFLSGTFFPLSEAPPWILDLAKINPLTYAVDAFRQIILSSEVSQTVAKRIFLYPLYIDALFLLTFSVVTVSAAIIAFNRKN